VHDKRRGYIGKDGVVNFERAPIKYAVHAGSHTRLKLRYLPFLRDLRVAFDIGVGPAQMFLLLRDSLGITVTGIDAPAAEGASVLALWPIFDRGRGVEEHAWFMDMCARRGAERVVWRFNRLSASEPILAFYREKMHATAPRQNDPGFLIVPV
jgi:hypothetical protein